MTRLLFAAGAAMAFLGVAAGAFGTHALQARLAPDRLATWELATRYQMIHALALLGVAWASTHWERFPATLAGGAMLSGIVVFSGTLYALALGAPRWFGAITPIGGVALLVGWAAAAVGAVRG